jgi:glutamine synthetase
MSHDAEQPTTPEDVLAVVRESGVRFIRLWFTDILGQLKSFSINSQDLEGAFEAGMGFDGSSITGFNAIEESRCPTHRPSACCRGARSRRAAGWRGCSPTS